MIKIDQLTGMLFIIGMIFIFIVLGIFAIEGLFETAIVGIAVILVLYIGARVAKAIFEQWATEDPIYNLEKKW